MKRQSKATNTPESTKMLPTTYYSLPTNKGFIALTSAIIVSILILTVVFAVSATGFFGRFNILDAYLKERSSALAEACTEKALLKLAENPSYTGNETLQIGDEECFVYTIGFAGDTRTIETRASVGSAVTNLEVVFDVGLISIVSWKET